MRQTAGLKGAAAAYLVVEHKEERRGRVSREERVARVQLHFINQRFDRALERIDSAVVLGEKGAAGEVPLGRVAGDGGRWGGRQQHLSRRNRYCCPALTLEY